MMKQLSMEISQRLLAFGYCDLFACRPVNVGLCKRFIGVPVGINVGKSVMTLSFKYS